MPEEQKGEFKDYVRHGIIAIKIGKTPEKNDFFIEIEIDPNGVDEVVLYRNPDSRGIKFNKQDILGGEEAHLTIKMIDFYGDIDSCDGEINFEDVDVNLMEIKRIAHKKPKKVGVHVTMYDCGSYLCSYPLRLNKPRETFVEIVLILGRPE